MSLTEPLGFTDSTRESSIVLSKKDFILRSNPKLSKRDRIMGRSQRKHIAEETLRIIREGRYKTVDDAVVHVLPQIEFATDNTRLLRPGDFLEMSLPCAKATRTTIEVVNETTFAGARALLDSGADEVCSLNFASAKNPGGGFLGGSQAQEEALCRASSLYDCLLTAQAYYDFHRSGGTTLYSDHMIYSPRVPVFRDDCDRLVSNPWCTSVVTSPAVNAGALKKSHPELANQIVPAMENRIEKVLRLAAFEGHRHIVLGAWGCGVFRNDPGEIAQLFRNVLRSPAYRNRFERIRFSVLDTSKELVTFKAFEEQL